MRVWMDVAVLARTRNKDGRLAVRSAAGLPFLLDEGMEVAFVPPQTDLPRRSRVNALKMLDDHSAEVVFDGVGAQEAAGLAGCHCLVRRAAIDESRFQEEPAFWEGWLVVDEGTGPVGEVEGIVENTVQDLLEVNRDDGAGMLLVPVVDEIVLDVLPDRREIRVALPKGLLDL